MAKSKAGRKDIGSYALNLEDDDEGPVFTPGLKRVRLDAIYARQDLDTRKLDPRHVVSLARSIAAVGLINPVAIDTAGRLIAGAHRLAAWELLSIKDIEERRDAFLKRLPKYKAKPRKSSEDDGDNPKLTESEKLAKEVGELDISGWKDAHPDSTVPVMVFESDDSEKMNKSLLREVAENEKRRSYTEAEVDALAVRLEKAGFEDVKGRPPGEQESLRKELAKILGKSSRQVRRYLNDPKAIKAKRRTRDRLSERDKFLNDIKELVDKPPKILAEDPDASSLLNTAAELTRKIAAYQSRKAKQDQIRD